MTWYVAANAVCQANGAAISVSDGTDAVQSACQPHPVVSKERTPCITLAQLQNMQMQLQTGKA